MKLSLPSEIGNEREKLENSFFFHICLECGKFSVCKISSQKSVSFDHLRAEAPVTTDGSGS